MEFNKLLWMIDLENRDNLTLVKCISSAGGSISLMSLMSEITILPK